jgi:hypothetical protein
MTLKETAAMDIPGLVFSLGLGISLSAACGFRIFVPMLAMGIAQQSGHVQLASDFEWIGSWPAIIAFGTATVLEIGAYYIPWLDNLLDTIATPAALAAGTLATAAAVGDMTPVLRWSVAAIAGGGAAVGVQALTVSTRAASTATTGGVGNPIVSTVEAGTSTVLSILAIILPILALVLVILIVVALVTLIRRIFRRRRPQSPSEAPA